MDIIVVGAGIVGCAVAHELASRGARVRVFDPRGIGRGATHASAGILAPYIEGHSEELLRIAVRSFELYDRFIERVQADAGCPVEYHRHGTLQAACTPAEASTLAALERTITETGVECSLLDRPAALRLEPRLSTQVQAALLVPSHAHVVVRSLVGALEQAATRRGVIFSTERITAIDSASGAASVSTESGVFSADLVIDAAGSWASRLLGPASDAVRPIRGQLVHVRGSAPGGDTVIWGPRCYLVPWDDGSMLVGATVEDVGFDEHPTAEGVNCMLSAAIELLPALRGARFEEVRVGLRPRTEDELPAIGPSSTMPHVYIAAGHYRNGVLLTPLTATLVADHVMDGREGPELALMRPARLGL